MSFGQIVNKISKPVYFGQFKRVGIEAMFAINTAIFNVIFTNVVSFASLSAKISVFEFELSGKLTWT